MLHFVAFHAFLRTQAQALQCCCHCQPPSQVSPSRMPRKRWSHQRCHCQRAHPRDGGQTSRQNMFGTRCGQQVEYWLSTSCPPLTPTLSSSRRRHCALPRLRLDGQSCHQKKMVFAKHRQEVHQRGTLVVHSHRAEVTPNQWSQAGQMSTQGYQRKS